jgi:hypothetical protein
MGVMLQPFVEAGIAMLKQALKSLLPCIGEFVLQALSNPLVASALSFFDLSVDSVRRFFGMEPACAASAASAASAKSCAPVCPMLSLAPVHNALCDHCSHRIIGDRFKCTVCSDYDLCAPCHEIRNLVHGDHKFRLFSTQKEVDAAFPMDWPSARVASASVVSAPANSKVPCTEERDDGVTVEDSAPAVAVAAPAPVPEVAKPSEVAQPVVDSEPFPYQDSLNLLTSMGFADSLRVRHALMYYQGNAAAAVDSLLRQ